MLLSSSARYNARALYIFYSLASSLVSKSELLA